MVKHPENARCRFCGDLKGWSTEREFDEGICELCMRELAGPDVLSAVANWLEDARFTDPPNPTAAAALRSVVEQLKYAK